MSSALTAGVRLSAARTEVALSDKTLSDLKAIFQTRQCLHLSGLLSPDFLQIVHRRLAEAAFDETTYTSVGSDQRMAPNAVLESLHLAANDPEFLRVISTLAGDNLTAFWGRIYRMLPGPGHATDWHDDLYADRHIGMSVNLSTSAYGGGVFELRRVGETDLLARIHNTGPGDAILFRLSPTLEHRVTAVEGAAPKTAFAGWFRTSA